MEWESKLQALRAQSPDSLVCKILIFGVPANFNIKPSKHIIPIMSSRITPITSLATIMCDITTDFLGELAVFAIAKQLGSFKSPALKDLDLENSPDKDPIRPLNSHLSSASTSSLASSLSSHKTGSKSGSLSLGVSDRSKTKQKARSMKFGGDLYLISGRLSDALRELSEAAALLRSTYDHLWHGSALESIGVCLVLLSFLEVPVVIPASVVSAVFHSHTTSLVSSSGHVMANSNPSSTPSSQTNTPPRTSSPGPPHVFEFLPDLISTVLRYYSRSQSSAEEAVPQIVYCETALRFANLLSLARIGGGWNGAVVSAIVRQTPISPKNITTESPSISAVASWCAKIHTTDLSNLPISLQAPLYCGLATVYSSIGLFRKRGLVMRELFVNLIPRLRLIHAADAASIGVHPTQVTNAMGVPEGFSSLMAPLCDIYGAGDIRATGFGWTELKVSFLQTCISLCESLNDPQGIVTYSSILLSIAADMLNKDDQLRIFSTIVNALETGLKMGLDVKIPRYWDRYLLRDIIISKSSSTPKRAPDHQKNSDTVQPFLYNPFGLESQIESMVYVQREPIEISIKLQNPFAFEVHISDIRLTTDTSLEAYASNVYLAPLSMHDLLITAIPTFTGPVEIRGCSIQVAGCDPELFELTSNAHVQPDYKVRKVGIGSAVDSDKAPKLKASTTPKVIKISVVDAQPVLLVKSLSLNNRWIMLLEGEKAEFTLALQNISDASADSVILNFVDSTMDSLQSALSSKDLPANELYEVEYFLYNRQAFKLLGDQKESTSTAALTAQGENTYRIQVNGKRGLTEASIEIDYGAGGWVRQLSIPLNVTVDSSTDLTGWDVVALRNNISFLHNTAHDSTAELTTYLTEQTSNSSLSDYCLFLLDVRNSWTRPLEVTLNNSPEQSSRYTTSHVVSPNTTHRFVLPVKRLSIGGPELDEPIPSLRNRQFIFDSLSPDQARIMRHTFWYREKLLEQISGQWKEVNSERHGDVELRAIRLTGRMVNILRVEAIEISMDLPEMTPELGINAVKVEDFTCINITVSNQTESTINGMLQIIPMVRYKSEASIDSQVLINGTFQRPLLNLAAGESRNIKLGVVFLAAGEYEWSSVFEELLDDDELRQHNQRDPFYIKVNMRGDDEQTGPERLLKGDYRERVNQKVS